jgi:hypothetical protein
VLLEPVTETAECRAAFSQLAGYFLERPESGAGSNRQPQRDTQHEGGLAEFIGDDQLETEPLSLILSHRNPRLRRPLTL